VENLTKFNDHLIVNFD